MRVAILAAMAVTARLKSVLPPPRPRASRPELLPRRPTTRASSASPVLLTQNAQEARRGSTRRSFRLLVGKNERVAAPQTRRASPLLTSKAGDDAMTAKVQRAKKKASIASLSARCLTVTGLVQGAFSNSDLQTAVLELARQYFGTTAEQDQEDEVA